MQLLRLRHAAESNERASAGFIRSQALTDEIYGGLLEVVGDVLPQRAVQRAAAHERPQAGEQETECRHERTGLSRSITASVPGFAGKPTLS